MSSKFLAYFIASTIVTGLYFAALLFFGAVMDLEIQTWILIGFALTVGNYVVALGLMFYHTFHIGDED